MNTKKYSTLKRLLEISVMCTFSKVLLGTYFYFHISPIEMIASFRWKYLVGFYFFETYHLTLRALLERILCVKFLRDVIWINECYHFIRQRIEFFEHLKVVSNLILGTSGIPYELMMLCYSEKIYIIAKY